MQTSINVAQAFGLVGEMYDLTPRRVDAFETANDINIGECVCRKSDGSLGAFEDGVFTAFAGICVRAHESINYGATKALDPSLKIPAGATAQVASMGRIFVPIKLSATVTAKDTAVAAAADAITALKALSDIVAGATLYFKDGLLTPNSSSATAIGKFIKGADISEDVYGITTTTADSATATKFDGTAVGYVNVVIEIG